MSHRSHLSFFGGLKGFLIHFVSHHSYLCGVEVYHTRTHETLLLVGDMKDAVVVTSVLYLSKFLLALQKRFVVEGWSPC